MHALNLQHSHIDNTRKRVCKNVTTNERNKMKNNDKD